MAFGIAKNKKNDAENNEIRYTYTSISITMINYWNLNSNLSSGYNSVKSAVDEFISFFSGVYYDMPNIDVEFMERLAGTR